MASCSKCGIKPKPSAPAKKAQVKSASSGGLVRVGAMSRIVISFSNRDSIEVSPGQLVIMPRSQADELQKGGYPIWIAS